MSLHGSSINHPPPSYMLSSRWPSNSNRWSTQLGILQQPPSGFRADTAAATPMVTTMMMDSNNNNNNNNKIGGGGGGGDDINDDNNHYYECSSSSVVADHSTAVESFFASIRVPASFLAATSFSELFAVEINANQDDTTPIQKRLQTICLICQGVSFVLSMNVIVLSTQALTRSLTGNFDPYAETGYEFLFREFHFEFVCVRWSFIVSLYGFLLAVTAKILYGFELFNTNADTFEKNHLELGIGVCLLMGSLLIHLHSYVNSTLVGWNSMLHMTIDMLKMLVSRGKEITGSSKVLEPLSLVLATIGLFFIIMALIPGAQII